MSTYICVYIYVYIYMYRYRYTYIDKCIYFCIHICIYTYKKPTKMAENYRVSGGHSQAGSLGGPWTGWIGSAPVQISGCGLDGALSWWCDELLLVVVVLHLSVVPRGQAIGLLATKGISLRITADREKGGASWRQVGLSAQSLPRRRFTGRRACMRAYVHVVRVCMYMCMYVCVLTCIYV